jgi:hypothetical protein
MARLRAAFTAPRVGTRWQLYAHEMRHAASSSAIVRRSGHVCHAGDVAAYRQQAATITLNELNFAVGWDGLGRQRRASGAKPEPVAQQQLSSSPPPLPHARLRKGVHHRATHG